MTVRTSIDRNYMRVEDRYSLHKLLVTYKNRRRGVVLGKPEKVIVSSQIVEQSENVTVMEYQCAKVRPKICLVRFAEFEPWGSAL